MRVARQLAYCNYSREKSLVVSNLRKPEKKNLYVQYMQTFLLLLEIFARKSSN